MSCTIPLPPREQLYNRYCSKLEYIENSHVGLEDMAQVRNLVGTSRIISKLDKLDLQAISNMLPNSKLEEQKFAEIKILLGQPVCTVLLFTCCKMVLTGSKSMLDCILASTSVFHHILQGFQGFDFQLEPVKIQNIVGNAQISLQQHEKQTCRNSTRTTTFSARTSPTCFQGSSTDT